jgi:signal transduction histidine kinase
VSPFVRLVWAAYPVLDAVLLALVLRVLLSRRARSALDASFAVGVCLWLGADVLYLHVTDSETALILMDAAWMVAPVLLARAAWRVREDLPAVDETSTPTAWLPQLLLAVFPLAVPPLLELVADLRGREDQPLQLFVGMVAVMALALVRAGRLILSEERAQRELVLARDAALAASEAKSMFLANISHELRTPLTTVLVTGGLLTETSLDPTQRNLLERMHRSGTQLQSLVESVLDFSRLDAGQAVLQPAEFDLHLMVTDVVDAHLPRATRKGIGFAWEIDPGLPRDVVGDRTRVFQVLSNLVENALKFTEAGRVHVSARPVEGRGDEAAYAVEFVVADTGIGIGDDDQAAIFESFRQVDGSATRHYQGTGLGLAICKDVTELLGGTISVESELGVGSTFTVRIPLDVPPGHEVPVGPAPAPAAASA